MLTKFFFAVLRASLVVLVILLVSREIENSGTAEGNLFVIFLSGIAFVLIVLEYTTTTPTLLEFRYARPYNLFRALIALLVITTLLGFSETPMPLLDQGGKLQNLIDFMSAAPMPAYFIMQALDYDPQAGAFWLFDNIIPAWLAGIVIAVVGGIWLWVSNWPFGKDGFDLWRNMPNFHPTSGKRATEILLRSIMLNTFAFVLFPFIFALVLGLFKSELGFDFKQTPVLSFWILVAGLLIPVFLLFKSIALLKLCVLAESLRKID